MTERLVVIGGDAAGMSAASQARRLRGPDELEIVAFERGRFTSYAACGIPYWIGGLVEERDALIARTPEVFRDRQGIDVRIRHEVTGIDTDARTVRVTDLGTGQEAVHDYDQLLVATGATPVRPPVPGIDAAGVLGVQTLVDGQRVLDALEERSPRRAVVIGAGYIGLEMAGMLRSFGVDVTVIAMENRVLEMFDPMISHVLERHMEEQGIARHLGATVTGLEGTPGAITVHAGEGRSYGPFERVLWAVGRRPKTRDIGLAAAGVEILPNGIVPVNEWQETNVAGVFALGDVIGKAPLTPVAIAAGRRLADHWLAPERDPVPVDYAQIPTVTFTHPPTGGVGMTEPAAVQAYGDSVRVYETEFGGLARAFAKEDVAPVAMKLICAGADERVVGIHMVGDEVDEMLQGFAVAVRMGATKRDFDLTIPLHPTSAEELVTLKVARPGQTDPLVSAA